MRGVRNDDIDSSPVPHALINIYVYIYIILNNLSNFSREICRNAHIFNLFFPYLSHNQPTKSWTGTTP